MPSVSSHSAGVVAANGAGVSTPAMQSSASGWPASVTAANSRPTAASSLTSVGTAVARPPAALIRPATASSASASRAASTTCAPAAATATAVAAPIPRLAPVTTASRPASHLFSATRHLPVETLVRVQGQFQVQVLLGMLAAGRRGTARLPWPPPRPPPPDRRAAPGTPLPHP